MIRKLLPGLLQLGLTVGVASLVVLAILMPFALTQPSPQLVITTFLLGPLDSLRHLGNIAEVATPIALTGLAATIVFRSGLYNLGMESGVFLGGLAASAAAIFLPLSGVLASTVAIGIGAMVGSLACIVPGWLRLRHGAPEMVTSLVLNLAILNLGIFALNYYLRDPNAGALVSYSIPAEARLDRLLAGTRLNTGSLIAVAACLIGGVLLFRTTFGLQLRIIGASPGFGGHLGLSFVRVAMTAQVIGGLIAGLAGAVEVLGLYTRFSWTSLPGLGWTGMIVAILARDNPFLVLPAALFLGWLQVGADLLARELGIPAEVSGLMTAAIMLVMTASLIFRNPRLLVILRNLRSRSEGTAPRSTSSSRPISLQPFCG